MAEALPPEAYARIFEGIPEGAQILEELVARFGRNPYVKGGLEAQRQTDFNAGQMSVVTHILTRINAANGAPTDDDQE